MGFWEGFVSSGAIIIMCLTSFDSFLWGVVLQITLIFASSSMMMDIC